MHSFWAIDSSEDTFLNRKTELIEFVSSSVSANWPEPLSNPVQVNLKNNKQIKFYNGEKRGYFLHELNTNTWIATAKGVLNARDRRSKIVQLAKFQVNKDHPGFKKIWEHGRSSNFRTRVAMERLAVENKIKKEK